MDLEVLKEEAELLQKDKEDKDLKGNKKRTIMIINNLKKDQEKQKLKMDRMVKKEANKSYKMMKPKTMDNQMKTNEHNLY